MCSQPKRRFLTWNANWTVIDYKKHKTWALEKDQLLIWDYWVWDHRTQGTTAKDAHFYCCYLYISKCSHSRNWQEFIDLLHVHLLLFLLLFTFDDNYPSLSYDEDGLHWNLLWCPYTYDTYQYSIKSKSSLQVDMICWNGNVYNFILFIYFFNVHIYCAVNFFSMTRKILLLGQIDIHTF